MLPLEHSAILLTFIKLPFVIKIFVLSIFERPFTHVLLNVYKSRFYMIIGTIIHVACITKCVDFFVCFE